MTPNGCLGRSWPVGTVAATDRVAERATYAGPEARRPAPAGRAPGPDLLRPACRSRPLPHDRPACNGSGGLGQDDGELHSGATELRPSQTARQRVGGAGRRHPVLPPSGGRIPDRGLVPEVVPSDLRALDGRYCGTGLLGRAAPARAARLARSVVRRGGSRLESAVRLARRQDGCLKGVITLGESIA